LPYFNKLLLSACAGGMLNVMALANRSRWGIALLALCALFPASGDDSFSWNNTIHFEGRGSGASTRDGSNERLSNVNVDIDRGGKILVSFRTEKGKPPLTFSGSLIDANPGMLKADVASDDPARLRGSMYLSRNGKNEISRIALEATNGQEHLHVEWTSRR
jgi:hypothetical protein